MRLGLQQRGYSIDPAQFLGIFKVFSAARCVWFGIIVNSIVPAHFLGKYNAFLVVMRSFALRGALSFWAPC